MESISRGTVKEVETSPVFPAAAIRPVATFLDQEEIGAADGHDYASGFEREIGETEEVQGKDFEDLLNRLQKESAKLGGTRGTETFGEEFGVYEAEVSGDFHYHHPPQPQESSGVLPDRFRSGRESLSVIRNVTVRESKRAKARSKDHEYQRRFSSSPSMPLTLANRSQNVSPDAGERGPHQQLRITSTRPVGGNGCGGHDNGDDLTHPRTTFFRDSTGVPGNGTSQRVGMSPGHSGSFPLSGQGHPPKTARGTPSPMVDSFELTLIHEGNRVGHQVTEHLPVMTLIEEASTISRLHSPDVILMLFG
jgi:hypothetical protein